MLQKKYFLMLVSTLCLVTLCSCGEQAKEAAKDTGAVIDYATGASAVKAKKQIENKVNRLNQQHNADLDKALNQ